MCKEIFHLVYNISGASDYSPHISVSDVLALSPCLTCKLFEERDQLAVWLVF